VNDLFRIVAGRWFGIYAALLGIGIPLVWFYTVVVPGEEAVTIRNALVARMGVSTEFEWTPSETPPSFLVDRGPVPPEFAQVAARVASTADDVPAEGFELAQAVARHLMSAPRRVGGPVQSGVGVAYAAITRQGRGYCADFTQVFTAISTAVGLPVRTWAISFESFGAGHTFNEVFDNGMRKWVLIDSFHSLYFVDAATHEPLSVIEVHDRLLALDGLPESVLIRRIGDGRFPFRSDAMALDYYRRGMPQLALSWGSNVFDYERSMPIQASARVSRHLERLVAILLGTYPKLLIYPEGVSERDVATLFRARDRFLLASAALGLALLTFGWQLVALIRRRGSVHR